MAVRLTVTRSGTPKKKRDNPEQRLAIAVADFLRIALPTDAAWWHTPNSIWTTVKQAGVHKAMGVKAGVADILIAWGGGIYAIELKSTRGRISVEQDMWRWEFERAGGQWAVAWSFDDVLRCIGIWGIPLRASVFGKGVATSAGSRRAVA